MRKQKKSQYQELSPANSNQTHPPPAPSSDAARRKKTDSILGFSP